jgi:hypothetical protein
MSLIQLGRGFPNRFNMLNNAIRDTPHRLPLPTQLFLRHGVLDLCLHNVFLNVSEIHDILQWRLLWQARKRET